ncbi:hypothetical protein D3C77_245500 [compost metagenome]
MLFQFNLFAVYVRSQLCPGHRGKKFRAHRNGVEKTTQYPSSILMDRAPIFYKSDENVLFVGIHVQRADKSRQA